MEIEFVIAAPPGSDPASLDQIPAVRAAYARGPVQTDSAEDAVAGYWFRRFGVARQDDWPAAPFRLSAAQAGSDYWLCADPVYLQLDRDRMLLDQDAVADLDAGQADALIGMLNAHFGLDGLHFVAVSPRMWVLRPPRAVALAAARPAQAAGLPAAQAMPSGPDAAWARRLANETQMLLHQSSVNQAREARRLWPVNSLWFWGGGQRRAAGAASVPATTLLFSSVKHVRELAQAAGIQARPLPPAWPQVGAEIASGPARKVLIDLTDMSSMGQSSADWTGHLQSAWLAPAQAAAASANLHFWSVVLTPAGSFKTRLYGRDLFHFLRGKSLAHYVDKRQN